MTKILSTLKSCTDTQPLLVSTTDTDKKILIDATQCLQIEKQKITKLRILWYKDEMQQKEKTNSLEKYQIDFKITNLKDYQSTDKKDRGLVHYNAKGKIDFMLLIDEPDDNTFKTQREALKKYLGIGTQRATDLIISEAQYKQISNKLNIDVCVLKSVVLIETGGKSGFEKDGVTPKIRYEGHYMRKFLLKDSKYRDMIDDLIRKGYNDVIYNYEERINYNHDLKMLQKAREIDQDYANKSASWGIGQIMGANYKQAGFNSIDEFVQAQNTLSGQIETFMNFCANDPILLKAMREKDFETFARLYNGKNYKDNDYDTKMDKNYEKCK